MSQTRREFLRRTGCALTAAALASTLERFQLVQALTRQADASDYRALVCVFLDGGNDGNNVVIPYDDYDTPGGYGAVRGASVLGIPKADLLQISPPAQAGRKFGLHPNLSELQTLFNQQRLAVLCNTGTLVEPLTRALYRSGAEQPYQLFSHSDQVQQQYTSVSARPQETGWGGRVSDAMTAANGAASLPMLVSVADNTLFATGTNSRPLVVDPTLNLDKSLYLIDGTSYPEGSLEARRNAFDQMHADDGGSALLRFHANTVNEARRASEVLKTDPVLPPLQPGQLDFPSQPLGFQLKTVAKLISLGMSIGIRRQIFFCKLEGFDHHSNQRGAAFNTQDALLLQLSRALKAFYDATLRLGVSDKVTTFTLSDFARTFEPSGSSSLVGTDHAWGNHQLVMGGAVRGGDFYGTYPTLALGGPDDADTRGRWIPTTSLEQYAATLATWFGLPSADVPRVFPFINRFATSNLGFML